MIKNITANPIVYNELGELTKDNGVLDFDFNDTRKVKYVVLQEDIAKSQRVELFDLYIKKANGKYKRVYKGTVIGSKKIINLKGKKQMVSASLFAKAAQTRLLNQSEYMNN